MRSLYKFLLGLSVIFMVACGSSYKKNPHLSKIDDDVTMAKNQIENKTYTVTTNDLKVEEKEYEKKLKREQKKLSRRCKLAKDSAKNYQIVRTIKNKRKK